MTKADGAVIINSEINTDGAEAGVKDINKALDKIVSQLEKLSKTVQTICDKMGKSFTIAAEGVDMTAKSADNATEAVKKTAKEAKKAAKEVEKAFLTVSNDEGTYKLYEDGSKEWIKKKEDAAADEKEPVRTGGTVDWEKIEAEQAKILQQINESTKGSQRELTLVEEIKKAREELKKLEADGFGAGDDKYDSANKKLIGLSEQLRSYSKTMVYETQQETYTLDTLEGKIAEVNATIEHMKSYGGSIEDADMQAELKKLSELKAKYKELYAESTKTDAQRQAEEAKNEAKIAAMNKKLEETRAKEVQAAVEAKRLQEISNSASVSDEKIVQLNKELEELNLKMKDFKAAGVTSGYEEYDATAARIREIKAELKNYQKSVDEARNKTSIFETVLKGLKGTVSGIKGILGKIVASIRTATGSMSKLGSNFLGLNGKSKSLNTSLNGGLKTLLKYGLGIRTLYALVNKLKSAITTGISNLANYDATTSNSITSLSNALTRLQNSLGTAFAPILNVVAPILTKFINMLSTAISYVSAFFAALTGQSTYQKAIGVQNEYTAAVGDTASAAQNAADSTQKAEDAAKSYLTSLDNINKVEADNSSASGGSGGSGGGGSGGTVSAPAFETVAIDNQFKDLADKVKDYFKDIFKPMQDAWKKYGKSVIKAWNSALKSTISLLEDIAKTFKDVWTDGTGYRVCSEILKLIRLIGTAIDAVAKSFKKAWDDKGNGKKYIKSILDMFSNILSLINTIGTSLVTVWSNGSGAAIIGNILQIFTNIHNTIGAISKKLEEAWNQNSVGETIIQNILNIVKSILGFVNNIAKSTKEWAENLDFYPLLSSIETLTRSISPLIDAIGKVFQKWWDKYIEPALKWLIETGIPSVLKVVSGLFTFLSQHEGVLETVMALLVGVFAYDKISPLATGIIGCISSIVTALAGTEGIGLIGTIQGVISLFTGSGGLVGGIQAVGTAMSGSGGLVGKIGEVIAASAGSGGLLEAITPLIGTAGLLGVGVAAVYATVKLADFIEKMQGGNGICGTFGSTTNNLIANLKQQGTISDEASKELTAYREELEKSNMSSDDMKNATQSLVEKMKEMGISNNQIIAALKLTDEQGGITADMLDSLSDAVDGLDTSTLNASTSIASSTASASISYKSLKTAVDELYQQDIIAIDQVEELNKVIDSSQNSSQTAETAYSTVKTMLESMGVSTEKTAKVFSETMPTAVNTMASTTETKTAEVERSVKTHISNAQQTVSIATKTMANDTESNTSSMSDDMEDELSQIAADAETYMSKAQTSTSSYTSSMATDTKTNLSSVSTDVSTYFGNVDTSTSTKWNNASENVSNSVQSMKTSVENGMKQIAKTMSTYSDTCYETITNKFNKIPDKLRSTIKNNVNSAVSSALTTVVSTCKTKGEAMGTAIVKGIQSKMSSVKNTINSAIGSVNTAIYNINGALNSISRAFTWSYDVTSPAGSRVKGRVSLNLPNVSKVPYLATGAVIPPNAPFTAVLGDQKSGNNIETPEALLRKIVREESGGNNTSGGQYKFTAQINRRTLFEEIIAEAKLARSQSGKNPFALT